MSQMPLRVLMAALLASNADPKSSVTIGLTESPRVAVASAGRRFPVNA